MGKQGDITICDRNRRTGMLFSKRLVHNGNDPYAWLTDTLGRIAGHKITKLGGGDTLQFQRNRAICCVVGQDGPNGYLPQDPSGLQNGKLDEPKR